MSQTSVDQPKKSLVWKIIVELIKILFPVFSMIRVNSLLKRSQKMYKHSWFTRQRMRNLLIGMGATLPFLVVLSLSIMVMNKDPYFIKGLVMSKNALINIEPINAYTHLSNAFTNVQTAKRLSALYPLLLTGGLVTLVLGFLIRVKHPLIEKTKILYSSLQRTGLIEKDEKNRLVLYTPLGCLVDIKGSTPKAVKEDTKIWTELNIKIKDYAEDPEKISVVFFKKTYELKDKYIYNIS